MRDAARELADLQARDDLRAAGLRPGTVVRNPLGQAPWVLDVLAVHGPDAEQMVTLIAVQDCVRVAADWPVQLYTAADADLESSLVLEEHHRLHEPTTGGTLMSNRMSDLLEGDSDAVLADMHAELVLRGHTHLELIEVEDVPAAKRMLGLDLGQPLHAVRVHFPGDRLVDEHEIEEAIRGLDRDEALANARWNWPAADRIDYVGHHYEVGDPVVDATNPARSGRVVTVLDGHAIKNGPRQFVRFAGAHQDQEVSRNQIRFTGPETTQDEP